MMKRFQKSIIVVLFLIFSISVLTGCEYSIHVGPTHVLKKEDAKKFTIKKTSEDTIKQIEINTSIADVELIPSDSYGVEINYLYWEEAPQYKLEDGKLYFNDAKCIPNSYSVNFNLNNTIKVYLPKNAPLENLEVDNSSGDVYLSSFVAHDMNVTISSGDLTLEQAAAVNAEVDLSSGDSDITDFQVGKMDITCSSGDLDFTNMNAGESLLSKDITYDDFSVDASSGDITINGLNSGSISLSDSSGDINCKGLKADRFDTELSSGGISVLRSDLGNIELDSGYGDIDLGLIGSATDYSLDLDTSSGKITVDNKDYDDHLTLDKNGDRKISAELSSGDINISFENK